MKVVINKCFGGFSLSEAAYEKLIEWGVPVRPNNAIGDEEVILDHDISPQDRTYKLLRSMGGRYWDTWLKDKRAHPLLVRVVEELGERANGDCASLAIVEIPDGAEYEIAEYDGNEHIAEKHRTWG